MMRAGECVALPPGVLRLEFRKRARDGGEGSAAPSALPLGADGEPLPAAVAAAARGAVVRSADRVSDGDTASALTVDLAALPPAAVALRVQIRAAVPDVQLRTAEGAVVAVLDCAAPDQEDAEPPYAVGEFTRDGEGWVFRAGPARTTAVPAAPSAATLTAGTPAVSLARQGAVRGTLAVIPRWQPPANGGSTRLDLCALFELTDGSKGVVQSLGGAHGALDRAPFLRLGGDPRTGEHLTVNLDRGAHFRRVLLFVSAYGDRRGLEGFRGSVALRPQHGADVGFALDPCAVPAAVCVLALLTHDGADLVVRREARYLVPPAGISPQRTVDYAYGWGLNWTTGADRHRAQ